MRSRRSSNSQVAEVARRRLELLGAELAAIRPDSGVPPTPGAADGSGEPTTHPPAFRVDPGRPGLTSPGRTTSPGTWPPGRHARRLGRGGPSAAAWLGDRLPSTLQGRVRLGASHITVVAVMVAVGLGFLAWWSVRAADPGDLAPARSVTAPAQVTGPSTLPSPGTGPPSALPVAASGSTSPPGEVVVDVAGRVRRPGIVRLPPGSRVVDALDAAGGVRPGVKLTGLNLARVLADGEQVLVGVAPVGGVAPEAAAAPVASPGGPMVNINTADSGQLETLPGVGPVTAAAILEWRAQHGAFTAVEELLEVSGIGDATLADLAPFVTL